MVRDYLHCDTVPDSLIYKELICLAMRSVADLCIIPIQDYMGYTNEARINTPSTLGNNWKWRLKKDEVDDALITEILKITKIYGRCPA